MSSNPVRVLIVDDHTVFAETLKLLLDRDGEIEVVGVASDGAEAVDLAVSLDPEVVLMDLSLPRLDGFEAARRLLAIKRAAKVIALTGRREEEVADGIRAAGMSAYLSKDHVHEHVQAAIHSAAGR
jgi:two-component system, NarL family, response regulator LiaR